MPLTDIKIRQAKATDKAVKLADTAGLYLEVKPNSSKLWRYRYRIAGRENLFAIGEYPQVSLADAGKARDEARELIKQGRHRAHARQSERTRQINANALTFKAIAEEWIEKKRGRWAPLSIASIAAFVFPAGPALLVSVPMALLYAPLMVAARLAWRYRTRAQVDRALDIVKGREVAQPFLCRVKQRPRQAMLVLRDSGWVRRCVCRPAGYVSSDISSIHFGQQAAA